MIVFISLQGFYVSALGKAWNSEPLVVGKDSRVLDANAGAVSHGIQPGMSLKEARAIVHGCPVAQWEPGAYRAEQRKWLDYNVRYTDLVEPVSQHQAFLDLGAHPDPVLILGRLLDGLRELGFEPSFGVSQVKWIAKVSEARGDDDRDAYYDRANFVAGLPVSSLLPVFPEHRERLEFLGYRTVREVAKLPREVLRPQFGLAAISILQAARAEGPVEAVRAAYPERSLVERFAFDGVADSEEVLSFALEHLARRLSKRLIEGNLQGKELKVWLEWEDGEFDTLRRKLTRPIQSFASVLFALRLAVLSKPCEQGIVSIRVHLPRLERPREIQQRLDVARSIDSDRHLKTLVEGVRGVFGDASVELASEQTVPRRSRLLRAWKNATGWA